MLESARVAIVTGGGTGIGRAVCVELVRRGCAVVVADLDGQSAEDVASGIRAAGGKSASVACDVSEEAGWKSILDQAAKLGSLVTLVGNAAIYPRLAFADTTIGDFDRVMAVNFRAAFLGIFFCWPLLRDHGGGSFVFMTSGSGQI